VWVRNRLLAKIDQEIELTRQAVERSSEEISLSREAREGDREYMRELTLRNERVFRDLSAGIRAGTREILEEVREGREEQRAQTQALLRLIDRMDRLDPGGAAA
jgi:hypothetical protein